MDAIFKLFEQAQTLLDTAVVSMKSTELDPLLENNHIFVPENHMKINNSDCAFYENTTSPNSEQ